MSHTSSPVGAGGGNLTTPGESAATPQTTLGNLGVRLLDSNKNNSTPLPEWVRKGIETRDIIISTAAEMLAGERPTRANIISQAYESRDVSAHDGNGADIPLRHYIIEQFLQYIARQEKKHLILRERKRNVKGQPVYRCLPFTNRFSAAYQRNVTRHLNGLIRQMGGKRAVMLTLTMDPKPYGWDTKTMWKAVKSEFNRFLTDIFRIIGHRIEYLCVPEAQPKSGLPHLHILFFNVSRVMDWREILRYWKVGGIHINRTPAGKHIGNPIKYITKYLTKTFNKTNSANVLSQATVWYYGIRSFTQSRKLMPPLSKKSSHRYELAGNIWCFYENDWKNIEVHPEIFDILLSADG